MSEEIGIQKRTCLESEMGSARIVGGDIVVCEYTGNGDQQSIAMLDVHFCHWVDLLQEMRREIQSSWHDEIRKKDCGEE